MRWLSSVRTKLLEYQQVIALGPEAIRNFCIVAHIDHGKSTLSDRLLQTTGALSPSQAVAQSLDTLEVEKERGITVKAQTASMVYRNTLLNLVDTPGHVDFSFEVGRSVAATSGALLLVDASQGIQAQTLANFRLAQQAGLVIVPVVTKIDLEHAQPDVAKEQLLMLLDIDPDEVIECSAKTGIGSTQVLDAIVDRIPSPDLAKYEFPAELDKKPRARLHLLDSWFDIHRGVICLVKVVNGELKKNDVFHAVHGKKSFEVQELGIFAPERIPLDKLRVGQVGYVIAGIKSTREVILGDTLVLGEKNVPPELTLPKFVKGNSMVYASIYPCDHSDFNNLRMSMDKLLINDASVEAEIESSDALGMGFRCGFNGVLHMEVFCDRLQSEFGVEVVITAPTVPYRIWKKQGGKVSDAPVIVQSPREFPGEHDIVKIEEPMVFATVICPDKYLGPMNEVCQSHRGSLEDTQYIGDEQVMLRYCVPLSEVVTTFYNRIKSVSSGHATVDFEDAGFREGKLVKLDILINGEKVEPLSAIVDALQARNIGKKLADKLRKTISRQNFEIVIQAALGSKVIARERIPPYRKDVLMKSGKLVGGGDVTRKMKLLEKQKEGKKRMKQIGNVNIPQEAFLSILKM